MFICGDFFFDIKEMHYRVKIKLSYTACHLCIAFLHFLQHDYFSGKSSFLHILYLPSLVCIPLSILLWILHVVKTLYGWTACRVWGCVAAARPECPYWPLSTTGSTCNRYVSIRDGPWSSGRWWHGLMNQVSFSTMCSVHVFSLTWRRDGTRMHYGKKVRKPVEAVWCSGQSSAQKPWILELCGHYLGMYHLPKDCWRPSTPP